MNKECPHDGVVEFHCDSCAFDELKAENARLREIIDGVQREIMDSGACARCADDISRRVKKLSAKDPKHD